MDPKSPSRPACYYGENCAKLLDEYHIKQFSHPGVRLPCKIGKKCPDLGCRLNHNYRPPPVHSRPPTNLLQNPYTPIGIKPLNPNQKPNPSYVYTKGHLNTSKRSNTSKFYNQNPSELEEETESDETGSTESGSESEEYVPDSMDEYQTYTDLLKEELNEKNAEINHLESKIKKLQKQISSLKGKNRR